MMRVTAARDLVRADLHRPRPAIAVFIRRLRSQSRRRPPPVAAPPHRDLDRLVPQPLPLTPSCPPACSAIPPSPVRLHLVEHAQPRTVEPPAHVRSEPSRHAPPPQYGHARGPRRALLSTPSPRSSPNNLSADARFARSVPYPSQISNSPRPVVHRLPPAQTLNDIHTSCTISVHGRFLRYDRDCASRFRRRRLRTSPASKRALSSR